MLHLLLRLRRWKFSLCWIRASVVDARGKAGTLQRRVLTQRGASWRLELALGALTLAMRYPSHFPNWGGPCARGLERSFWRYASAEAFELVKADAPRKRSQPKRDEAIVNFINSMTEGLSIEFQAILENDVYRPGAGSTGETTGENVAGQREEYASAPLMPDVEMADGGQLEEENLESTDPNHEIHVAARERAMNSFMNLVDGTLEINNIAYLRFA